MLDHLQNKTEASYLASEAVSDLIEQETMIVSRLRYTKRAILTSLPAIANEDGVSLRRLMVEPSTAIYFTGVDYSPDDESHQIVAAQNATDHLNGSLSFVSSMALIYTHSFVEDYVMRILKLIMLVNPKLFEVKIVDKSLTFKEISTTPVSQLAEQRLTKYLEGLSREGLLKKVELLESLNQTSHQPSSVIEFEYRSEEVTRIDKLRHSFAHLKKPSYDVGEAEDDIKYLFKAALHLHVQAFKKHGIRATSRPKCNGLTSS
jgi:hypothetical protein